MSTPPMSNITALMRLLLLLLVIVVQRRTEHLAWVLTTVHCCIVNIERILHIGTKLENQAKQHEQ